MTPADRKPEDAKTVPGADWSYTCGCYWFCGNLVACVKHGPKGKPEPTR